MENRYRSIWSVVGIVCALSGLLLGVASIALKGGTPVSVAAVVIASCAIGLFVLAALGRSVKRKGVNKSGNSR
jgi:O-antigen/teichoic acid export membrane protein